MHTIAHQGLRATAALFLVGLAAALGWFNIQAWWTEGLTILAILAGFSEGIALVFAVMTENAVREKRFDRALACAVILLGFAGFNMLGGHRAWEASQANRTDRDRQAAQAALDKTRGEIRQEIASAQTEIAGYAALLPAADAPRARQAGMMEGWTLATSDARQRASNAQQRLDRLPIVAEVQPPFAEWLVWAFLGLCEFAKAAGLWAIGAGARRPKPKAALPPNVTELDRSEIGRRLNGLRKDRQATA